MGQRCWGRQPRRCALTELLADHTTFGVGGPAGRWVEPGTETELIAVISEADAAGEPLMVLGGGSNVLIGDEGFAGTVVHTAGLRGVHVDDVAACSGAFLTVAAGEPWDRFVAGTVVRHHLGIEALSGIPGLVGATPVQNVGAYGQEVSQTIARVRTWDRRERVVRTFSAHECGFGYRSSLFKREPGRWVVLSVSFQFRLGDLSAPIRYAELAQALGVDVGERAPLADVRTAVLALRRGKGMVYDRTDHDSWSAGSFFTNPILADPSLVPDGAPSYPQPDGQVKTSAAWLIEHAGFSRGYGVGPAQLSSKHALALTNAGGATAAQIVALAVEIRDGVERTYGIRLVPEPVLIGVSLDG
jgi:UDP-N-acetylmuramate dehydrogenase